MKYKICIILLLISLFNTTKSMDKDRFIFASVPMLPCAYYTYKYGANKVVLRSLGLFALTILCGICASMQDIDCNGLDENCPNHEPGSQYHSSHRKESTTAHIFAGIALGAYLFSIANILYQIYQKTPE